MNEKEVAEFLRRHTTFFHGHLDLLEELSVPHPVDSDKVVSLLERQVGLLRSSTEEYKQQFKSLVQAARDNSVIVHRSKKIVSASMDCDSVDDFLAILDDIMRNDFSIQHHSILLFSETFLDINVPVSSLSEARAEFKIAFSGKQKYYKSLTDKEKNYLFSGKSFEAQSFAAFPLIYHYQGRECYLGLFALASEDENYFYDNKTRLSLDYFSELLSLILIRLMK